MTTGSAAIGMAMVGIIWAGSITVAKHNIIKEQLGFLLPAKTEGY